MNNIAANDNIAQNDSYDWLSVLRPQSFEDRAAELAFQLNNLVADVEYTADRYDYHADHYKEYIGTEFFEGEGDRPEFLTAEYNYELVRTCLMRGYIALRHIDLLNDLAMFKSDFAAHNRNDADFTLGTAIAMKNGAKKAFLEIADGDDWHSDPDVEHVTSLSDIKISIETLEEMVMDHFRDAASSHKGQDKQIIKPRPKRDLVDEMNLNIHLYSIYTLAQLGNRLSYAKGLFNAMAKDPDSLPHLIRENYPHPDLYMKETLFAAQEQLNIMPETIIAALQYNDLSIGTVSRLVSPVISGQTRRGLPLYGFDPIA